MIKSKVFVLTSNIDSRIGKLADKSLIINAPSKTKKVDGFSSIQPMTTLNEQCLTILFDSIVLNIMDQTAINTPVPTPEPVGEKPFTGTTKANESLNDKNGELTVVPNTVGPQ
mgnify:CR=1 FL=1